MRFVVITNSISRPQDLVEKSLSATLSQLDPHDRLFFIDQNSSPLTLPNEIKNHSQFLVSNYIVNGVSEARNHFLGQPWSEDFDWIVFCDDDGFFSENYIRILRKIILNNPSLEIIAGSILTTDGQGYYSPRHKIGGSLKSFRNHKLLMGSNFAVKRETFVCLGGFDTSFGTGSKWGSGEESDFCINAYFNDIQMEYFKELSIFHLPPRSGRLIEEIKKAWKYALGKGALVYKWLIKRKQPIILLEFFEMLIVPWIQFLIFTLKVDRRAIIFPIVFFGRIFGFFKAVRCL